jgi:acetylornithine deacetylase/succinyl-diaminopimelate desuccinylase-like protein
MDKLDFKTHAAALMPQILEDLSRLVACPSVAFPGYPAVPVLDCANETLSIARDAGFSNARLMDLGVGYPTVYAEIPAPPGKPTVLMYAHYDIQPAPVEQGWESDPFRLTRKEDGRWYGRGAADNKSGVVIHTGVMRLFNGRPPVGVRLVIEGEEEAGSHLEGFISQHPGLFQADAMFIADMGNILPGEPVLTTALRGHALCMVEVRTLQTALHSGVFGGVAPDALVALIQMLSKLHDERGNTTIPGLGGSEWSGAGLPEELYRQQSGMLPGVGTVGDGSVATRLWSRPSVTVLGIDAPTVAGSANVLIPGARARVALRVPAGEDAAAALQRLVEYLRSVAPWGVQASVTPLRASDSFLAPTGGPGCQAALEALEQAYGRPASQVGSGGSIPLLQALSQVSPGAEFVLWGAEDMAYARIHGPNESVDPLEIERIMTAEALTLLELGK